MNETEFGLLFLSGMAGQGVRAALGLIDWIIKKPDEKGSKTRFIVSMLLGGILGSGTSYLIIPYAFTDIGILLAIFSGLSFAYIIENIYKIMFS